MLSPINPADTPAASAGPVPALPPAPLPPMSWGVDLDAAAVGQTAWLWDGYLARGGLTLLTSQWKAGKTTLLSVLLARREAGGALAGRGVVPGKTAVVTEEGPDLWAERRRKLGFGPSACFLCRPFVTCPSREQYLALLDRLAELHDRHGVDLAVIDPLVAFLPGHNEANAALMMEALAPLQRLKGLGMAVLLLHHPRKGAVRDGQAARGSGALTGHVDIVIEMQPYTRASDLDRRRVLLGYSRHERTPRQLVIELNEAGTDYVCHGTLADEAFSEEWAYIRQVLEAAHTKLTRKQILARWPAGERPPSEITLWRHLDEAVVRGLVLCEVPAQKTLPYSYWLPGMEERWKDDPRHVVAELLRQEEEAMREAERILKQDFD